MTNRKQKIASASDTTKTMSTLQLWQQQMAALQRASKVRNDVRVDSELHETKDKIREETLETNSSGAF